MTLKIYHFTMMIMQVRHYVIPGRQGEATILSIELGTVVIIIGRHHASYMIYEAVQRAGTTT